MFKHYVQIPDTHDVPNKYRVALATASQKAGMGSSRTGLELEDTSRTNFGGLGLKVACPGLRGLALV